MHTICLNEKENQTVIKNTSFLKGSSKPIAPKFPLEIKNTIFPCNLRAKFNIIVWLIY